MSKVAAGQERPQNETNHISILKELAEKTIKMIKDSDESKNQEKSNNILKINTTLRDIFRRGTTSLLFYNDTQFSISINMNKETMVNSLNQLISWANQFMENHEKISPILLRLGNHDHVDRFDAEFSNDFDIPTYIVTMSNQLKALKVRKNEDGSVLQLIIGGILEIHAVVYYSEITSIVVRGPYESLREWDVWTKSKHAVFREINNFIIWAHGRICSNPHRPNHALRTFVYLVVTYADLFNKKCFVCDRILRNLKPPTMRTLEGHRPHHPDCL